MQPYVFIGSSLEGKAEAEAIQLGLQHDARPTVWDQAFPLSMNTLDTLLKNCRNSDFAVFVLSADDTAEIRENIYSVARDNVLFEAGLFMGMHGKERVFIVTPRGTRSFHMPTDFLGFTAATYDPDFAKQDPNSALAPAVTQIKQAIRASSWAHRRFRVRSKPSLKNNITWPLKLNLTITNSHAVPVVISSIKFLFDPGVQRAPNAELDNDTYTPKFLLGQKPPGKDLYESECLLQPHKSVGAWVPFDPDLGLAELESLAKSKRTGTWHYRCMWLDTHPTERKYEEKL
jgi:hypothetical protein